MPQDLPPLGGYEAVQYKRNIPTRGLPAKYYMLVVLGIMGYGWYKLVPGLRERQECLREKSWARIHITPLLQAEEDRDQVRRYYADLAREKELLGTESSAYNSKRFVRPTFGVTPRAQPRE